MKRRSALSITLSGMLLLSISPLAKAEGEASGVVEAFSETYSVPKGFAVYSWRDASEDGISPTSSLPQLGRNPQEETKDPEVSMRSRLTAVLPLCSESKSSACLLSVESRVDDGVWLEGEVLPKHGQRWFNEFGSDFGKPTGTWKEDIQRNLPAGDEARLWKLATPHSGGNSYLVSAMILGHRTEKKNEDEHNLQDFELSIRPTTVTRATFENCSGGIVDQLAPTNEFFNTEGNCVRSFQFPSNLEIRVKVKMGFTINDLGGFLDGRLFEPQFIFNDKTSILTVSGRPLETTRARTRPFSFEEVEGSPKLCELFNCKKNDSWSREKENAKQEWNKFGYHVSSQANTGYSLEQAVKYQEFLAESSFSEQSIWQVSSMIYSRYLNGCPVSDGFAGVVSSNASIYSPEPPRWNKRAGSLDYKVVSPHLRSDGRVFEGQYVLLLTPRVARCLWGADYSKGTASLSVLYEDGEQKVASSSLLQRNGWVQFRAFGFHYSSPTIRAKILPASKQSSAKRDKKSS